MVTLLWFVSVPIILFYLSSIQKDNTRLAFVPFMISGVVFMAMITAFGGTIVIFSLFDSNEILTQVAFGFCLFVFLFSGLMTAIYRCRYSERDLIRTDEEEIVH